MPKHALRALEKCESTGPSPTDHEALKTVFRVSERRGSRFAGRRRTNRGATDRVPSESGAVEVAPASTVDPTATAEVIFTDGNGNYSKKDVYRLLASLHRERGDTLSHAAFEQTFKELIKSVSATHRNVGPSVVPRYELLQHVQAAYGMRTSILAATKLLRDQRQPTH
mmetsp:Transcript_39988/g.123555  ORF Transcript_39988/g.123555 Transcript_39988/m.123555 type:complete len:168 (-) Transcript_39988:107-610(-)